MMNTSRILLVEDDPSDIDLTKRAFEQARINNELVVAQDGREAIDLLIGAPGDGLEPMPLPALVLLDLRLPVFGGLEVLRRIREDSRTRRLPVVILTSSKEEEDVAASYDLGVNSYIRKPVDFGQFSDAVRELGLYWLVINETPPPVDASRG
jgi:two-component system, response regulator